MGVNGRSVSVGQARMHDAAIMDQQPGAQLRDRARWLRPARARPGAEDTGRVAAARAWVAVRGTRAGMFGTQ